MSDLSDDEIFDANQTHSQFIFYRRDAELVDDEEQPESAMAPGRGACFNCGSTAHQIADCPLPKDVSAIVARKREARTGISADASSGPRAGIKRSRPWEHAMLVEQAPVWSPGPGKSLNAGMPPGLRYGMGEDWMPEWLGEEQAKLQLPDAPPPAALLSRLRRLGPSPVWIVGGETARQRWLIDQCAARQDAARQHSLAAETAMSALLDRGAQALAEAAPTLPEDVQHATVHVVPAVVGLDLDLELGAARSTAECSPAESCCSECSSPLLAASCSPHSTASVASAAVQASTHASADVVRKFVLMPARVRDWLLGKLDAPEPSQDVAEAGITADTISPAMRCMCEHVARDPQEDELDISVLPPERDLATVDPHRCAMPLPGRAHMYIALAAPIWPDQLALRADRNALLADTVANGSQPAALAVTDKSGGGEAGAMRQLQPSFPWCTCLVPAEDLPFCPGAWSSSEQEGGSLYLHANRASQDALLNLQHGMTLCAAADVRCETSRDEVVLNMSGVPLQRHCLQHDVRGEPGDTPFQLPWAPVHRAEVWLRAWRQSAERQTEQAAEADIESARSRAASSDSEMDISDHDSQDGASSCSVSSARGPLGTPMPLGVMLHGDLAPAQQVQALNAALRYMHSCLACVVQGTPAWMPEHAQAAMHLEQWDACSPLVLDTSELKQDEYAGYRVVHMSHAAGAHLVKACAAVLRDSQSRDGPVRLPPVPEAAAAVNVNSWEYLGE